MSSVTAQKIAGVSLKIIYIFFTFHVKEKIHKECLSLAFLGTSLHLAFLILIFHDSGSISCLLSEAVFLPSKYEVVSSTQTFSATWKKKLFKVCVLNDLLFK